MAQPERKALGELLLAAGEITTEQLEVALSQQKRSNQNLGKVLQELGFVTEAAICRALAAQAGVPFVNLEGYPIDAEAVKLVPEQVARRHKLVPLELRGDVLVVAQPNPFDVLALDRIRHLTRRRVEAVCATESSILATLDQCYGGGGNLESYVEDSMRHIEAEKVRGQMVLPSREGDHELHLASVPPIVKLIDRLMLEAVKKGATDIHIEPEEKVVTLRYRVDGMLIPAARLPRGLLLAVVSRLKVMANLDISEQRLPQEGRATYTLGNKRIDLRVSTFPTVLGEKVAIRLLEKEQLIRSLEELGFSKRNLELYKDLLRKSNGIILITGPTGVGKTTTLYSTLAYLNSLERNIMTIEDPVEYEIQHIRQTQVNIKAGLTFARGIRSILRQDPDVLLIGEIRDPETAKLAVRAALSGVLVFSTLHTQDSVGAIPRLMDMGVEPFLLASTLIGVVAQRLVRIICPHCKEPVIPDPDLARKAGIQDAEQSIKLYRGRGCPRCDFAGFRGRTAIHEIFVPNADIYQLIRERADSKRLREAARASAMRTLLDDGLAKALAGITSLEEVLRVTYQ